MPGADDHIGINTHHEHHSQSSKTPNTPCAVFPSGSDDHLSAFDEECAASDILGDTDDGHDGEMTIMNDDDEISDDETEEEVMEHSIAFQVSRATVTRTGLLPCCVFVGRVTLGTTDWEIYFGQKQLLRLHLNLFCHQLYHRRKVLQIKLPWTIWREKRAERRVADVHIVQEYIRQLLKERDLRNSEPLLAFLEASPSRAMPRYGPSLKEGYVHMRVNGPFQLPLYTCFNRTIEALYRHLYRTWMRIAFVSAIVGFIFPVSLLLVTNLPQFFSPQKQIVSGDDDGVVSKLSFWGVLLGIVSIAGIVFFIGFVYKFFDHRLGVVRRWVVLKPSCFAAYRNRSDREPSEVFLFDKTFTSEKGSHRQGVSWMPSGLVVGSRAGFIEIDTGHYYTRATAFVSLVLVCWAIMEISSKSYDYQSLDFPTDNGVNISSVPELVNVTTLASGVYCGYYFTVPDHATVHIDTDDSDIIVSEMTFPTNTSLDVNLNSFWQTGDMSVFTSIIGGGSVVGVAKEIDPENDLFFKTGYEIEIPKIGNLTLEALEGNSLSQFATISHLCAIPVQISPVDWSTFAKYVGILILGGIVAPAAGLGANYMITYVGLWHAHVRRDHWYRCVRRLQKLKRQATEYRYHSFAPQRISSTLAETHARKCNKSYVENAAARTLPDEEVDHLKINSNGSTLSSESSFIPPPPPSSVSWHVDGEDTYEAMYKAITNAKYEIMIAGWWVCPDLFLLRPGRRLPKQENDDEKKPNTTQLRNLLLKKAEAGVKIYVLIYREVKLALTLNSAYTKRSLMMHPNIRVLRDPIFQIQSLGFWSHHEKIVCIDQSLAFVGGLDLCFGRYDYSEHPLSDYGGSNPDDQTWRGKDYSNPIIKDFIRVNQPYEDLIDRFQQPRMPWHDVHCSISGPPVQDIAYHFIQRWNFVCSKNDYQLRTGWCICFRSRRFKLLPKCIVPMDFNGWTLRYPSSDNTQQDTRTSIVLTRGLSAEIEPFEVMTTAIRCGGSSQRSAQWGNASDSNSPSHSDAPMTSIGPLNDTLGETEILRAQRGESILQVFHPNANVCNIQVVRSVSMWSAGVPTEASVQEAYIDVITKSKHYLYIENQFFISGTSENGVVSNRILQALVDRIKRAVQHDETYRVYVVMPLLPAFEGNIRSEELTNLHAVMHWQFETISRGKHSLFSCLASVTNQPENYVSFFGLRKYGILPNGCVSTEQIYIHSKLLIADDQYVIIGSANINDRSMCGDRDSEIALVIEDMQFQDGYMNDLPSRRGVTASALRLQLFREHLGLPDDDVTIADPASEQTWQYIKSLSVRNTKIFESVFDCAPSNRMRAFTSFQNIEVTQIYENQRLNVLKVPIRGRHHVWDKENLKEGDYAPWTDVNGVPISIDRINLDDFVVDNFKDKRKKYLLSMDHDGWCYARNFSIFQEVRTGTTEYRKREKLQHLVADRLMAQVRRRRWVKKGTAPLGAIRESFSESEESEEEHGRWHSLWRRLQAGDFSRANSFNLGHASNHPNRSTSLSNDASPNSPVMSTFRRPPRSPSNDSRGGYSARTSSALGFTHQSRPSSYYGGGNHSRNSMNMLHDTGDHRNSNESGIGKGIAASLKRWYSVMDAPDSRRSLFSAEYFDKEEESYNHADEPLLESGRMSRESVRTGYGDDEEEADKELDDCQIGQVQTAAIVPKEKESRARGQLSEIRGHLVEFPLDFLAEEILKPSILPADIHI